MAPGSKTKRKKKDLQCGVDAQNPNRTLIMDPVATSNGVTLFLINFQEQIA